jgi:hypothetical protein
MKTELQLQGVLLRLPRSVKNLILIFISTLMFGFVMGLEVVYETTSFDTTGIKENYLGNEENEDAEILIFKKSPREIRTMIHNHVLSLSTLFLVISILVLMTSIPTKYSTILAIEPFISLFLTFGGIYLMWKGVAFMNYLVLFSGILMSLAIGISLFLIVKDLLKR